jgi:hypothetical protein
MKIIFLFTVSILFWINNAFSQELPNKFIPTYYIKYGRKAGADHNAEYSSKFDLIIASYNFDPWAEKELNSWQALKSYNPKIIIAIYQMGPSECWNRNTGGLGDGWDWIKANHGADAGLERWTGSGHKYSYLTNSFYPSERFMNIGNPGWQKYWIEKTYEDRYITKLSRYEGADAIFSDNTHFEVVWSNSWYEENNPGKAEFKDHPLDYATANGIYDNVKWKKDMTAFFNLAMPYLASRPIPVKFILNFGHMGKNPEQWVELDTMKNRIFAAMEEGAFVHPWSKTYNISDWETKIKVMKNLKNISALMNNIGKVPKGQGMEKMDIEMTEGNMGPATGWDALWFSMTSFLMALNENKSNGYFGFSIWGYSENYYLDEYDPKNLHLGKPLGDYYIPTSGASKNVVFREYEDGWVVTNKPQTDSKTNVPVPKGKAWVVTHKNLKNPYSDPLVTKFDLGKNRGIILLKKGKKIGNENN